MFNYDFNYDIFLQILNEIAQNKIKIYDFPEPLEEEEEAKVLKQLRTRVPFAVVGANTVIEIDGKKVRGRRYPWGVAEGKLKLSIALKFVYYLIPKFNFLQLKIWNTAILLHFEIW